MRLLVALTILSLSGCRAGALFGPTCPPLVVVDTIGWIRVHADSTPMLANERTVCNPNRRFRGA